MVQVRVCACASQRQHGGCLWVSWEPPPRSLSTVVAVRMRQPAVGQRVAAVDAVQRPSFSTSFASFIASTPQLPTPCSNYFLCLTDLLVDFQLTCLLFIFQFFSFLYSTTLFYFPQSHFLLFLLTLFITHSLSMNFYHVFSFNRSPDSFLFSILLMSPLKKKRFSM